MPADGPGSVPVRVNSRENVVLIMLRMAGNMTHATELDESNAAVKGSELNAKAWG